MPPLAPAVTQPHTDAAQKAAVTPKGLQSSTPAAANLSLLLTATLSNDDAIDLAIRQFAARGAIQVHATRYVKPALQPWGWKLEGVPQNLARLCLTIRANNHDFDM